MGLVGVTRGCDEVWQMVSHYQHSNCMNIDINPTLPLPHRFMEIVNHYRGLAAARSTAAGLGSVMRAAGEELRPHVEKMLPKLYR